MFLYVRLFFVGVIDKSKGIMLYLLDFLKYLFFFIRRNGIISMDNIWFLEILFIILKGFIM